MFFGIATYWKCANLHCDFDIGPFGDERQASEIASQIVGLQAKNGKAVVQLRSGGDVHVDNSRAIYYKPIGPKEVDYDFDLPGGLDWLLNNGYLFAETTTPKIIRVAGPLDNVILDVAN